MPVLKFKNKETGEWIEVSSGGGGGSNVAPPDWNQNDPEAKDYIKNKPIVEQFGTLNWNGDTTGKISVYDILYKVSDETPTLADFANGFTLEIESTEGSETLDFAADSVSDQGGILIHQDTFFVVVYEPGDFSGLTFTEAGTYVFANSKSYLSALAIPGYNGFISKKLDPEYLPDGLATKADIEAAIGSAIGGSY